MDRKSYNSPSVSSPSIALPSAGTDVYVTSPFRITLLPIEQSKPTANTSEDTKIRDAILGYIVSLRSLGTTNIRTTDIASALSLPNKIVEREVVSLQAKGVKIL